MSDSSFSKVESLLCDVLKKASVEQVQQFTACSDLNLVDVIENTSIGQVLSTRMVLISLSGKSIKVLFKIHFSPDQIRDFQLGAGSPAGVGMVDKQTIDYMKELTNQVGGKICRIFEANGISLGMSIPLCVRGFYEIYSDYSEKSEPITKFGNYWGITGDFGPLFLSFYVELNDRKLLDNIAYVEDVLDEEDMEFL